MNLWAVDLDTDETTQDVMRAAALAYQLPSESRTKKAISPATHGLEVQLLRQIEHNQRLWHWANTNDAKNKDTAPEPIALPGEEEAYETAVSNAQRDALMMAESLGIKL